MAFFVPPRVVWREFKNHDKNSTGSPNKTKWIATWHTGTIHSLTEKMNLKVHSLLTKNESMIKFKTQGNN